MAKRNQYNKTIWSNASFLRGPSVSFTPSTTLNTALQSSGSTLAGLHVDTDGTAITHGSVAEVTQSGPAGLIEFTDVTLSATEEFIIALKNTRLASGSTGGAATIFTQTTATGSAGGGGGVGVSLYVTLSSSLAQHARIRVAASAGSLTNENVKLTYLIIGGGS